MHFIALAIVACLMGGCATRSQNNLAHSNKVYSGPCWMDPDTTGP